MKFYLLLFLFCFSFLSKAQQTKNPRNPTTTIAGRIIDQDGKPLPNVSLQASGGQVSVKSKNPDGDFRIPLLLVSSSQDIALTIILDGYYLPEVIIPNIRIIKAEERENYLTI